MRKRAVPHVLCAALAAFVFALNGASATHAPGHDTVGELGAVSNMAHITTSTTTPGPSTIALQPEDVASGISVSMALTQNVAVGQSVPLNKLALTPAQRAAIRVQGAPARPITAATSGYDVISKWRDTDKKLVYLRKQAHKKIVSKHNLTSAVVKKVTKSASWKGRAPGYSKTKYNYNLNFGRFICYPNRCILKEEVMVLTVVDFRSLGKGKGSYGVVTAYCETGKTRCPDYVKRAFNL